jgi:hypothetical protein
VLGLAAVVLACLASCGGGQTNETNAPPFVSGDPAVTFAPLVNLHEYEEWWPLSARSFLDYGTLTWAVAEPCLHDETIAIGRPLRPYRRDNAAEPTLDPDRLGSPRPYELRPPGDDCERRRSTGYTTTQPTRPYGGAGRPPGLAADEGYYVDLWTERLDGEPDIAVRDSQEYLRGIPVYVDRWRVTIDGHPGLRYVYWLLYGSNVRHARPPGHGIQHEGDWERLSVLLRRDGDSDDYAPVSVRFYRDGKVEDVPWRSLETTAGDAGGVATHPVVYAGRGSHTMYPSPGLHELRRDGAKDPVTFEDVTKACEECPEWRTWEMLRQVHEEPWYGYAGAWGYPRDSPGQEGPSPFLR